MQNHRKICISQSFEFWLATARFELPFAVTLVMIGPMFEVPFSSFFVVRQSCIQDVLLERIPKHLLLVGIWTETVIPSRSARAPSVAPFERPQATAVTARQCR